MHEENGGSAKISARTAPHPTVDLQKDAAGSRWLLAEIAWKRPSCGHLDLERNQQAWASGTMVRSGPPPAPSERTPPTIPLSGKLVVERPTRTTSKVGSSLEKFSPGSNPNTVQVSRSSRQTPDCVGLTGTRISAPTCLVSVAGPCTGSHDFLVQSGRMLGTTRGKRLGGQCDSWFRYCR